MERAGEPVFQFLVAVMQAAIDRQERGVDARGKHDQQERHRHDHDRRCRGRWRSSADSRARAARRTSRRAPCRSASARSRRAMPVKISGTAAGNRTERTIIGWLSLNTRPVLTRIGRCVRTAFSVNSATGMMPWIAPKAILADMPEPEEQQDDRIERDLGDRIERDQHRFHRLAPTADAGRAQSRSAARARRRSRARRAKASQRVRAR